jgi:hypothetical protein
MVKGLGGGLDLGALLLKPMAGLTPEDLKKLVANSMRKADNIETLNFLKDLLEYALEELEKRREEVLAEIKTEGLDNE